VTWIKDAECLIEMCEPAHAVLRTKLDFKEIRAGDREGFGFVTDFGAVNCVTRSRNSYACSAFPVPRGRINGFSVPTHHQPCMVMNAHDDRPKPKRRDERQIVETTSILLTI